MMGGKGEQDLRERGLTVVLLSRNFPPVIDGVGHYTFELYRRLKEKGLSVKVVTSSNVTVKEHVTDLGVERDIFPIIDKWNRGSIRKIMDVVEAEKADWFCIQYVPNSFNKYAVPFFLVALSLRLMATHVKVAVFFHEVAVRIWFNGVRSFFWGIAQRIISYSLYLMSAVSFTSNRFYEKYFSPFRIRVLPIPPNIFLNESDKANTRLTRGGGPMILVTFANRCTENLVIAVAHCRKDLGLEIELKITGSIQDKRKDLIKTWIERHGVFDFVTFFEGTAATEIALLFRHCDVFMHLEYVSRRGEGGVCSKSAIVCAAMAAGLPIIGTFGDMTDEQFYKNGENILFAEYDSWQSVSEQITRLCSDSVFRHMLGTNALNTYLANFSWEGHVNRFSACLVEASVTKSTQ
jgi:glycosyltransferase involved in cell wall biosynthesis